MLRFTFQADCRPTLALGTDSAGSACFAEGKRFLMTEPAGDLSIVENQEIYKEHISRLLEKGRPDLIACDLHPGFFSSDYAQELAKRLSCRLVRVQHHKAHAAGAALEHSISEYVGIACDGLGYGDDGNLWGGEIFDVKDDVFTRIGHLEEQPQIGGDSAALNPGKMLFGIISRFMDRQELKDFFSEDEINAYSGLLGQGFNAFNTTSTGRVLDAASYLLGICRKRTYEGQPAIELEKAAAGRPYMLAPVIEKKDRMLVLNTTELFRYLVRNLSKDRSRLAMTSQMYIAEGVFEIASRAMKNMVFSGGVAYNRTISGFMKRNGVLLNRRIPPGDAGLCIGQAAIANL